MTAEQARRGRGQDIQREQVSSGGAEGDYCARESIQEESADESAEWSEADLEGLATEEEAMTAGRGAEWERVT